MTNGHEVQPPQVHPSQYPRQVTKGLSVMIVLLISIIISSIVSFVGYFYIFPSIERKHFTTKVPDVRNLSVAEADNKLKSAGLYVVIPEKEKQESDTVDKGNVITQIPLPETTLRKGDEVILIVSKGMPMVNVPLIKTKLLEEAKSVITSEGLVVGNIHELESEDIPQGQVIDSNPQEKTSVKKGTRVDITVSKGKLQKKVDVQVKKVTVPSVIGKTLIEAKNILESKNLRLGDVKKIVDEDKEFDKILSQNPSAGKIVNQNTAVNVTYNEESYE